MTSHYRRLRTAAGVKAISPHGLRHTCATRALHAAHVAVKVVADKLGHAKASMTLDVYAHSDADAQRKGSDQLDDVLAGVTGNVANILLTGGLKTTRIQYDVA